MEFLGGSYFYFLVAVFVFFNFLFFYFTERRIFDPSFLFFNTWIFSSILVEFRLSGIIREFTIETNFLIFLTSLLFVFGFFLANLGARNKILYSQSGSFCFDLSCAKVWYFSIICLVSFVLTSLVNTIPFFAENKTVAYNTFQIFGLKYFVSSMCILMPLCLYIYKFVDPRRRYLIVSILSFVFLGLMMGRMLIVEGVFIFIFLYYYTVKKISIKTAVLLFFSMLFYFYYTGQSRVDVAAVDYIYVISDSDERVPVFFIWPYLYAVSSLNNVDYFINSAVDLSYGAMTFQSFFAFTFTKRLFDFQTELPVAIESFNTGTFLEPYLGDFGFIGALVCVFINGFIVGIYYIRFLRLKKISDGLISALFAFSSVMAVMANLFVYPPTIFYIIVILFLRKKRRVLL